MPPAGVITRIEAQKKRKNRLSIFLDEEFAFGLDIAVLARFNLKKGDTLAADRVEEILQAEETRRVRENAFRYLARRAHSEKELRDKLLRKQYAEDVVCRVLEEMKAEGFVDDLDFARAFAGHRLSVKPVGARRLRSELWQKGVADKIVDQVVQEAYAEMNEEHYARLLLMRQRGRYKDLDELQRKKRLQDLLLRRGFGWETIHTVMEEEDRQ